MELFHGEAFLSSSLNSRLHSSSEMKCPAVFSPGAGSRGPSIWKDRREGERTERKGEEELQLSILTVPATWKKGTEERPYPCVLDLFTRHNDTTHLNGGQ